jgi:Domain of unknown function (DUF4365)
MTLNSSRNFARRVKPGLVERSRRDAKFPAYYLEEPTMRAQTRKRRTREHIIADLSVNHVERHALLCGFTLERFAHDYGIDLALFTFNSDGEVEEESILLQVKATDKLRLREGQKSISFRIDRRDLLNWLPQMMPMILIVYDSRKETAYWLYLQSYFRKRADFNLFSMGSTVTVDIPLTNVLNTSAIRRFRRFRDRILAQTHEVIHDED